MSTKAFLHMAFTIGIIAFLGFIINNSSPNKVYDCKELIGINPLICGQKKNINHAKVSDIALIKGLSSKLARKIIYKVRDNSLTNLSDLRDIKGIGKKRLKKIMDHFYLSNK